jgi:putative transposase
MWYNENMPVRSEPFVTDQIYHIFNRGVNRTAIFYDNRDYQRFYDTLSFYRLPTQPVKLSYFLKRSIKDKTMLLLETERNPNKYVSLYCYAFMPNHFHIIARQLRDNGVSEYMRKVQNSYAKYTNTRHKRTGSLFEGPFRAIRVQTDEQLLHLSRYIHLNPYTSHVVNSLKKLQSYPWSSLQQYYETKIGICETEAILSFFQSSGKYKNFINDQAKYQQELDMIKHLSLEY